MSSSGAFYAVDLAPDLEQGGDACGLLSSAAGKCGHCSCVQGSGMWKYHVGYLSFKASICSSNLLCVDEDEWKPLYFVRSGEVSRSDVKCSTQKASDWSGSASRRDWCEKWKSGCLTDISSSKDGNPSPPCCSPRATRQFPLAQGLPWFLAPGNLGLLPTALRGSGVFTWLAHVHWWELQKSPSFQVLWLVPHCWEAGNFTSAWEQLVVLMDASCVFVMHFSGRAWGRYGITGDEQCLEDQVYNSVVEKLWFRLLR